MVGTAYTRGRSREYQTLRILRAQGWVCSRSAASHGPVDVFAGKNGRVLLIQVKSGKSRLKKEERKLLTEWAKAYRGRAEVWRFRKGRRVEKLLIYDGSLVPEANDLDPVS